MLLHSCPDMVQRVPLRETKTSAPLTRGSFTRKYPRQNITPAVADCRYRAPLSPRLCGPVKYTWTGAFCQVAKSPGDSELSANFFPDFTKSYSSAYLNSGIFVIGNVWFSNVHARSRTRYLPGYRRRLPEIRKLHCRTPGFPPDRTAACCRIPYKDPQPSHLTGHPPDMHP